METNADGKITRYKARLVDLFRKRGLITCDVHIRGELFCDQAVISTHSKTTMAYETYIDVKNAYLYRILLEEIYMKLPPFRDVEGKVVELLRLIYGLKQSGRN